MNISYFPPFDVLKNGLAESADQRTVTMSREMFDILIAAAVQGTIFDPEWYRTEYPDVLEAIETGAVEDPLDHYARYGYAEGRMPGYFEIDEAWYMDMYQYIAESAAKGEIESAEKFYNEAGYLAGQAMDDASEAQGERWREIIARSAEVVGGASD